MTILQIVLSVLLTVLQLALVVLVGPLLSGFRSFFSARMSGVPASPVLRRWFVIGREWGHAPPVRQSDAPPLVEGTITGIVAPFSLAAALCAVLLVPAFTQELGTGSWSDLLLVGLLLVLARFTALLPGLAQPAERATVAFGRALALALVLPCLFLLVALLFSAGATTGLASVLAGMSHENPFVDGAPCVLAGAALLAAVDPVERYDFEEPGSDGALLMLSRDIAALTWLTLASDLMWPGSLVSVLGSPSFLSGCGALVLGVLCWFLRSFLLAIVLATGRALALGDLTAVRLRAASALLLAVLALQLMTSARLMPPVGDRPTEKTEKAEKKGPETPSPEHPAVRRTDIEKR
ncbi:hypothetical protein [Acetobacter sp.]|jgi:hypothetical protein|uniref:hypothetical protein n=1 Tax=Acetobacter sp. TaxID=440 RepID=UPI0025C3625A|nr:hypothetical protein [Acetobacter sp.]MCH4090950.1 hypothetical protein [Acetobacter sp.]MCI1300791.1 hypothetical protein [Acetobacter sp.]MCI1317104.1 hypothetical protein [Acetobacter sp.]